MAMMGLAGGMAAAPGAVLGALKSVPKQIPFYTVPAGKRLKISSTGRRQFRIQGLDANNNEIEELIELTLIN